MKRIVGFSGGIDSQACARWVLNRFSTDEVILLNSDAGGNEHPLTTEFIAWYSANVHPVVCVTPIVADMGTGGTKPGATKDRRDEFTDSDPMTFDRLAYIKGRFPSRKAQFCTEHLKLAPAKRWIGENHLYGTYEQYTGIRRAESKARENYKVEQYDAYFDCPLHAPLFDWTKEMCFDFVKHHGEKINELYTLGFNRVGCAPCVNSSKDDILAWAQRFPAMIDKVREWERRVGKTFFAPMVPGMEINFVDDVVTWSKTMHGGKQLGLHVMYERPACESKYGLCE